jgi:hypothetical protein
VAQPHWRIIAMKMFQPSSTFAAGRPIQRTFHPNQPTIVLLSHLNDADISEVKRDLKLVFHRDYPDDSDLIMTYAPQLSHPHTLDIDWHHGNSRRTKKYLGGTEQTIVAHHSKTAPAE